MRRSALLAVLVLLAGCSGLPASDDTPTATSNTITATSTLTTSSTTTVPTSRTTTTTVSYNDCPYVLMVEPASEHDRENIDRVLAYQNLSAERQAEFDAARTQNEHEIHGDLPDVWSQPRLVRYEGTVYYTVTATC